MKIREKFLVTKMGLNAKAISEIVSIFKKLTENVSYENERNHFLLTKYKHRHNKVVDAINIDRIKESKEYRLNLMTKIIKLEPKIKVFKSREEEVFENIQKLLNYIN